MRRFLDSARLTLLRGWRVVAISVLGSVDQTLWRNIRTLKTRNIAIYIIQSVLCMASATPTLVHIRGKRSVISAVDASILFSHVWSGLFVRQESSSRRSTCLAPTDRDRHSASTASRRTTGAMRLAGYVDD